MISYMKDIGIDEVGRGCWAGPLVAGAVLLGKPISGLKDSKKLSKKERERLSALIREQAVAIGIGWVWPVEIDRGGLTWAVGAAMKRAFQQISAPYEQIIIDGNINYFAENTRSKAVIKADETVPSVSAASIVAKVARDAYMVGVAKEYQGYDFEKHVGYGTAAHIAALELLGITDIHRRSYKPIKAFLLST